jgi:glycosyltransferase involved in cell wall biosynthesis
VGDADEKSVQHNAERFLLNSAAPTWRATHPAAAPGRQAKNALHYHALTFVAWAEMDQSAALAALAELADIAVCGRPNHNCVEDVLLRQAGGFDLVYLHRIATADRYLSLVRANLPRARILFSVADLHHQRLARRAKIEARPNLLAEARALAQAEFTAAARADLVLTHSPAESALLRRRIPAHKVLTVPFAVDARPFVPAGANREGIAFLGSHGHGPNPEAAFWLVRGIMPRVWARDSLGPLDPRVTIVGHVPDLNDLFADIRLTVAPLRFGEGIKAKVL